MNSSTAATLPLFQASSWNLRTRALLFSSIDTGVYSSSLPTRFLYRADTMSMMPPDGVRRIDGRLIRQSAWKVHSRNFPIRGSPTFARKASKITHLVVAPLLAMLLHWVQPLPTGAVGMEYKRCTSYTSNTQSAMSKWHILLWRNTYEGDCVHKIRTTRGPSAQRGGKTYP